MVHKTLREILKINGKSKEVITVHNENGDIIHKLITPIMLEFEDKDVLQVIIGATLLAIPLAFTEEAWKLGLELPLLNIFIIFFMSVFFIGTFIFYNYYKNDFKTHRKYFFLRTIATYSLSFLVVAITLTLIQQTAWTTDLVLTFKRIVIVTFPASMSAAVADVLK